MLLACFCLMIALSAMMFMATELSRCLREQHRVLEASLHLLFYSFCAGVILTVLINMVLESTK